ncbi:putative actin-like family protein ARP6 [Neospora caninum Liverpool]|uniref:Actin-like family protein ARP6, putative n=1 Tax=Neospora caninum (strain Liverpool) TaxID=572307 RepID=F0VHF7_NEOCL|nr:putative actin-like family protein ARP6 [Neospora caninum Liverpool]CBZ53151.1 putative actin-like family protein ARP6 [Neospora caninum Liverpool]CEL67142.1 TPA: actin-like family protein ARP6, putative [Neospora caninum Liverpool]|eukprot:XP_003883183.1 putative actin-like family protein ARP6 [Neospora caninum Liverpool]
MPVSAPSPALVLDNGTGCLKIGFAGEALPLHTLSTCVGQVRDRQNQGMLLYGDDVLLSSNYFGLRPSSSASSAPSPLFTDLEMLRDLWEILFSHKRYMNLSEAQLTDHGVIVTEPFLAPPGVRQALSEVLFEDFQFKQVLFVPAQQAVPFAFLSGPIAEERDEDFLGNWGTERDARESLGLDALPGVHTPAKKVRKQVFAPDAVRWYRGSRGASAEGETHASAGPSEREDGDAREAEESPREAGLVGKKKRPGETLQDAGGRPATSELRRRKSDRDEGSKRTGTKPASLASLSTLPSGASACPDNVFKVKLCGLVVDIGFSGSMVVPYMDLQPIERAALRTSVGGNLLTTVLKNLCGFRSLNLERNELLVQRMKETNCFVSRDFDRQLERARQEAASGGATCIERSHLFKEVVLPEYGPGASNAAILSFFKSPPSEESLSVASAPSLAASGTEAKDASLSSAAASGAGTAKEERQTVRLCTERISVPEVLFHPPDVGSSECGIVELVQRSIALLPRALQPFACDQILLVGGSSQFPGLRQRLWKELRAVLPEHWPVNIYTEVEPQFSVWRGASCSYADRALFDLNAVTREQFNEAGTAHCRPNAKHAGGDVSFY